MIQTSEIEMVKFRLVSYGVAASQRKGWLNPSCRNLPALFSLSDVTSNMFSQSIINRLGSVKEHGVNITLRHGRGYFIGIQVVNKEFQKEQKRKLTNLKRRYTQLLKNEIVQEFLEIKNKLNIK